MTAMAPGKKFGISARRSRGKDIVPNAVAGIVVGKIVAIGAVGAGPAGPGIPPPQRGSHPAEDGRCCPACAGMPHSPCRPVPLTQVHQHRFNGIIQGVGSGDASPPSPAVSAKKHNGRCGRLPPPSVVSRAQGLQHQCGGQRRAAPAFPPAQRTNCSSRSASAPRSPVVDMADGQLPSRTAPA